MVDKAGRDAYALALEGVDESRAIDNMVIIDKGNGETSALIVRHLPSKGWYDGKPLADDFANNFSGTMQVFSPENGLLTQVAMKNGAILDNSSKLGGTSAKGGCSISSVQYAGLWQAGVFYITNINIRIDCGFSSGPGGPDPFGSTGGNDPEAGNDEVGGGSGGGGGSASPRTAFLEFQMIAEFCQDNGYVLSPMGDGCLVDYKLVDETNDPCVSGIIDKLQQKDMQKLTIPDIGELSGTGHLSQGILDLFNGSGDYDLTFKVAEAGSDGNPRNASTVKQQGVNNWNVTLDDDYVRNATQLSIARTVIHESVHAFIGYSLKLSRTTDLAKALSDYRLKLLTSGANYNQSQLDNMGEHNFISQFVDGMAHSLSVWDNNKQTLDYYKQLSWAGLENTPAYQQLPNKTQIQNSITNEATGSSNAKGTECP